MSISQKLDNYYSNQIYFIKSLSNGRKKDLAIGSLVADVGKRCISAISKKLNICRKKVKNCYENFIHGFQMKFEFRGRKSITIIYPNLLNDIEKIIENYKNVDSHFKTETLYVSISPNAIIDE